jgi:hypothetical protein
MALVHSCFNFQTGKPKNQLEWARRVEIAGYRRNSYEMISEFRIKAF